MSDDVPKPSSPSPRVEPAPPKGPNPITAVVGSITDVAMALARSVPPALAGTVLVAVLGFSYLSDKDRLDTPTVQVVVIVVGLVSIAYFILYQKAVRQEKEQAEAVKDDLEAKKRRLEAAESQASITSALERSATPSDVQSTPKRRVWSRLVIKRDYLP